MNVSSILALGVLIIGSSCSMKDRLTFFPDRISQIPADDIPGHVQEVKIPTSDGEVLQAFYFQHTEKEKRPLMLFFHGNAGNLYHRFEDAERLFSMGQDVLLVSYRGYARSTGSPTEDGIYIDGASAVQYAIDTLGYSEEDMSIFGRSLGTTVAVHIAQRRKFKSLILVTPLTSGKEMARAMGLGFLKFIAGNSYNSLEKINNYKGRILFIHGNRDEVIPYKMGKDLYNSYQGPKKMVTIINGRHNDLQLIDPLSYWGEIKQFLAR